MPINEIEMVINPAAPGMSRPENVQRNKKKKKLSTIDEIVHPSVQSVNAVSACIPPDSMYHSMPFLRKIKVPMKGKIKCTSPVMYINLTRIVA